MSMTMITSHLLCIVVSTLIGIWIGRRTNVLSGLISK